MSQSGYDINSLFQEAQSRWLKPAEVLFILQNYDKYQFSQEAPQKPTSGSLYLFNKRILRNFRKDGHNWRKKRDGRTVGEAHERLKVGNVEALNCYYAHGEDNPSFQRRSYWILDRAYDHIVLVHYRETSEGKSAHGSVAELSPSFCPSPSPSSLSSQNLISDSSYPSSLEVSSGIPPDDGGVDSRTVFSGSGDSSLNLYLKRLEEQLSLNEDSVKELDKLYRDPPDANASEIQEYGNLISMQDQSLTSSSGPGNSVIHQYTNSHMGLQMQTNHQNFVQNAGDIGTYHPSYLCQYANGQEESMSWPEVMKSSKTSSADTYWERSPCSVSTEQATHQESSSSLNFHGSEVGPCEDSTLSLIHCQGVQKAKSAYFPATTLGNHYTSSDYSAVPVVQCQVEVPTELNSGFTLARQQKFTIREVLPEWGYATEATKVVIVGSFLCDPQESAWTCMFGDAEVPLKIIQEGVILVEAPPHLPEKVTLCITSGNGDLCSEIREFEYRAKAGSCVHCASSQAEVSKSPEELLLLVRLVQMLLSDSHLPEADCNESVSCHRNELKSDEDSWERLIEALFVGIGTSSGTLDWLLQQLLKDKLHQWLSSKEQQANDQTGCSLSKKDQGIIHMIAGLGFEWALSPILALGVSVDFRDINGWTALHWAARFGREKMVATLLASGASSGAVTDPSSQDPTGRSPASIAAASGHKGLAGYLSEVSLTSHLSSLTLARSDPSEGPVQNEPEITVDGTSNGNFVSNDDQTSFKVSLAAVRNATQAAARIQSAFRTHSFRMRQQREAASSESVDEYGINAGDIQGLTAMSKLVFSNSRDHNIAALSIQKKYRGWKDRREFLSLRQKVVKIQAHVRGYQVRKQYKVICWAVGVLEKVVLRWRRRGAGLRGFRNETRSIEESEDEDILKVFRKQKVDGAIDESVSRVLSMVDSPEARQQYCRMLEAKAELGDPSKATATTSDLVYGDDKDMELFW